MIEAMQRTLVIAENAGIIGQFVDAKDEAAKGYYERYGFVSLDDTPLFTIPAIGHHQAIPSATLTALSVSRFNHVNDVLPLDG